MGRRGGVTSSGGTADGGNIDVDNLELSFIDANGNIINPTFSNTNLKNGANVKVSNFDNVVENLELSFLTEERFAEERLFAFEFIPSLEIEGRSRDFSFDLSSPLDLTARYLPKGRPISIADGTSVSTQSFNGVVDEIFEEQEYDADTIEYGLNSDELRDLGIAEFTFELRDENPAPGIQIGELTITIIDSSDPETTADDISLEEAISDPETTADDISLKEAISDPETITRIFTSVLFDSNNPPDARYNAYLNNDDNSILASADDSSILGVDDELSDSPISIPSFSIVLEAEELALDNYLVEDYEGGQLISRQNASGNNGTASLLSGTHNLSGIYDLNISYFDENDGDAELEILLNNTVIARRVLSEDTDSNIAEESNRKNFLIQNVEINPSDTLTIRGNDNSFEWARVDSLEITSNSTTIEAELLSLPESTEIPPAGNYLIQPFGEEGKIISLVGESGEANLDSSDHDLSGLYDLEISYFDVSGDATLEVFVGGSDPIEIINLNDDTDSTEAGEDNRRSRVIKNLQIDPFDDLTLRGTSSTGDRVSIDNINITAASVTIEAEDLITPNNNSYLIEDYEGGKLISRQNASGTVGIIDFSLSDSDLNLDSSFFEGTYDIGVTYFDENDGEGKIEVFVEGSLVGTQSLSEKTNSNIATEDNRREFIIENISLFDSDNITIKGTDDNFEWARIDNITFYTSDVNTDLNSFDSLSLPEI